MASLKLLPAVVVLVVRGDQAPAFPSHSLGNSTLLRALPVPLGNAVGTTPMHWGHG